MSDSILDRAKNVAPSGRALQILVFAVLVTATAVIAHAKRPFAAPVSPDPAPVVVPVPIPGPAPRIEAVFVLDTTGSMSGLIDGAKRKIWSIANQMASAQQTPEIRIGLVGYRDRGDAYVTRRFDLTDDIDAQYANLMQFAAGGGGDTPESVNQALHEAVTALSWSTDPDVYRVIFLVGDAPPHMDYDNDVPFPRSIELARAKDIVVNTIQCGQMADTTRVWRQMASLSQGDFVAIAQDGGMEVVSTPMDDRLAELNRELSETFVAYGAREEVAELHAKRARAAEAPAAAAASRLSYLSKKGGKLNSGRADLVDAFSAGDVALEDVPEAELPERLRALGYAERQAVLEEKAEERKAIQTEIDSLVADRDAYLKEKADERQAEGKADGFDEKVLGTLTRQAAEKGIVY